MQTKTLAELAQHVGAKIYGDDQIEIKAASTLECAGPGDISFLSNPKYVNQIATTKASAIVVKQECESPAALLVCDDPYYAFRQIVVLLHGHRKHKKQGISGKASIAETATLGDDCHVQDFATISENARIGARCIIYPGVFIGEETVIGDDCILYPNAVVYDKCTVGNRVIIQANATIGEDGFGFATHNGEHHKIPHIGSVIIEDDAEIGSGCGIERGTLDNTIIGKGSKIGDMVAIGHGTKVGPHCLLVAQVGIAGSTTLGHHCVVGGQSGISGHLKLGNCVMVAAQTGVINNLEDGIKVLGAPAIEAGKARRAYSILQYLPDMRKSIRQMNKRLAKLEESQDS